MQPKPLSSYLRPFRSRLAIGGAAVLISVALNLAIPFILRYTIDDLRAQRLDPRTLALYAAAFAAATLASVVFSYWMRRIPLRIAHEIEARLRDDLYRHLTALDADFFRRTRTGDLMTRMSSDMHMVRDYIGQGLLQGSRAAVVSALAFGVMFTMDARLSALMILLFAAMILTFFYFVKMIRRRHLDVQQAVSDISNFAQETFSSIRVIKGFAREDRWEDGFRGRNLEIANQNMRLHYVLQPMWPLFAFWFYMGIVLILIVGGRQVLLGQMTLGELVQFNQYLLYMQWPLLSMGWTANLIQRGRTSWERIRSVFLEEPAIRDDEQTDHSIETVRGDLVLDHVSFASGSRTLLDGVSLTVPEGSTLGITGPTGSGKTLLASLLTRQSDPTAGRIAIGGRDLRSLPLSALRRSVALAAQEPVLFSDTLAANISFAGEDIEHEMVMQAAEIAHLHADVESFPEKYETRLGERGVTLSGGQRQRTSLSRAIARNPDILILDDVLASVDTETEAAITAKLAPVLAGRTSIVISHRVSTLQHADCIVVLENGAVTQRGSHAELIRQEGFYRRLYEFQRAQGGGDA
jgi:ATP-binding cassette, subfamily B, multidrug efflux pump